MSTSNPSAIPLASTSAAAIPLASTSAAPVSLIKPMLVRLPDVCTLVGVRRPTIYKYVKLGTFPKPIKIGSASLWSLEEVENWIQRQIDAPRIAA